MADFYLDHNVPRRVALLLRAAGHGATTTRDLGHIYASDPRQLLIASRRALTLITHDDDFLRLHLHWADRPPMLRSVTRHAGIVLIPAFPIWDAERTLTEIEALLAEGVLLPGNLFDWHEQQWRQR